MDTRELEALVRRMIQETMGCGHGVRAVKVPALQVDESHRMDTGNPAHRVYTRDLFTLQESPRLGAGLMEMTDTTFPWTLNYDEMDYVVSGWLDIRIGGETISAGHLYPQGELHPIFGHRPRPVSLFRLSGGLAEPGLIAPPGRQTPSWGPLVMFGDR